MRVPAGMPFPLEPAHLFHACALQGHFQIILNPTRTPLFQWRLRLFDRLMYCSGCWSYTVGAITTPVFIAIPFLTIWIGQSTPRPAPLHHRLIPCACMVSVCVPGTPHYGTASAWPHPLGSEWSIS